MSVKCYSIERYIDYMKNKKLKQGSKHEYIEALLKVNLLPSKF